MLAFKQSTSSHFISAIALNDTTEERVTLLEPQVDDLTGDLGELEDEVTVLTSDQVLQDQRIVELEIDSDGKTRIIFATYMLYYDPIWNFGPG